MTDALLPIAYPIEDVPAIVGVPRTKIFQAIREHKLTARKVGRTTIVMRDDLVAWINLLPIKGRRFDTDLSVSLFGSVNSPNACAIEQPAQAEARAK